jgi:hypothetical protein
VSFEVARQVVVLEQDAVLERLMPARGDQQTGGGRGREDRS